MLKPDADSPLPWYVKHEPAVIMWAIYAANGTLICECMTKEDANYIVESASYIAQYFEAMELIQKAAKLIETKSNDRLVDAEAILIDIYNFMLNSGGAVSKHNGERFRERIHKHISSILYKSD